MYSQIIEKQRQEIGVIKSSIIDITGKIERLQHLNLPGHADEIAHLRERVATLRISLEKKTVYLHHIEEKEMEGQTMCYPIL